MTSRKRTGTRPGAGKLLNVLLAVKQGDFAARIGPGASGLSAREVGALNDVIQLNQALAEQLVRMSTVVGKEGRIAHRAALPGARGSWADAIDAVNSLVFDLVQPTSEVARVI